MNKTKPYFWHLLRQYRAYVMLYAIAYLVVYPVALYLQRLQDAAYGYSYSSYDSYALNLAPLTVTTIIVAAITPFIVLRFLYSKPTMDTYFSIPISRTKLFLKHFVFGWLMILVPLLVSHLLGYLIHLNVVTQQVSQAAPYTLPVFLGQAALLAAGSLILLMPSTLAILFTTNLFNGMLYAAVLHFLPLAIRVVWNLFARNFIGFTKISSAAFSEELPWIEFHEVYVRAFADHKEISFVLPLLIWFVIAIGLVAISMRLFNDHRVDRTDSAYMVKGFYPVIISLFGGLLLIGVMGSNNEISYYSPEVFSRTSFIMTFLLGFIVYFIVQIIRNHGVPKLFRTILAYVLIFAVSLGLTWLMTGVVRETRSRQMVDAAQVERIEVLSAAPDYTNYDEDATPIYFEPYGYVTQFKSVELTESQDIAELQRIQQRLIDFWLAKPGESSEYNHWEYPAVRFIYYNADNDVLQARLYRVNDPAIRADLEKLLGFELLQYEEKSYDEKFAETEPSAP